MRYLGHKLEEWEPFMLPRPVVQSIEPPLPVQAAVPTAVHGLGAMAGHPFLHRTLSPQVFPVMSPDCDPNPDPNRPS